MKKLDKTKHMLKNVTIAKAVWLYKQRPGLKVIQIQSVLTQQEEMKGIGLFSIVFNELGFIREAQAIVTLYVGSLMAGYAMGFSAVAIPDIVEEQKANTSYILPSIKATSEELSWFGKYG